MTLSRSTSKLLEIFLTRDLFSGRGCFEALGSGIEMQVGEIAFKSNFAFMDTETRIVKKRRVDREFPAWGIPLCDALTGLKIPGYPDHMVECKYATEHRCAIKVSGPRLSSFITGNDPLKDNLKLIECDPTKKAEKVDPDKRHYRTWMTVDKEGVITKVTKEYVNNKVANIKTETLEKDAIMSLFKCGQCDSVSI